MNQPTDRDAYVRQLLAAYRRLPDTLSRSRAADRRLATELHRRGVPFTTVEAALLLAIARRHARPPGADPLPPIRSLHYFLPLIEELQRHPLPQGYLDSLRARLAHNTLPPSAPVQKTTLLRER